MTTLFITAGENVEGIGYSTVPSSLGPLAFCLNHYVLVKTMFAPPRSNMLFGDTSAASGKRNQKGNGVQPRGQVKYEVYCLCRQP